MTEQEQIAQWIAENGVTMCPTKKAAAPLKQRKGDRLRPCWRCGKPIRYVRGAWFPKGKRRDGWHWVGSDGGHHRCRDHLPKRGRQKPRKGRVCKA